MPKQFWRATAEAVVSAVDAASSFSRPVSHLDVATFSGISPDQATAGLSLAADIGLLSMNAGTYLPAGPIARMFSSPKQERRAAALRVALENYPLFKAFGDRLVATNDASAAARQTKQLFDLDIHHDEIKETLLSLGQYAQALVAEGGGQYRVADVAQTHPIETLAAGCAENAAAEARIRQQLVPELANYISREDVLVPLGNALSRAVNRDARGAVVVAGNAVESCLSQLAADLQVPMTGAHGINAKILRFVQARQLTGKIENMSKYIGHIRNAADHGADQDVGAMWDISQETGIEFVFVACSLLNAVWNFTRPTRVVRL